MLHQPVLIVCPYFSKTLTIFTIDHAKVQLNCLMNRVATQIFEKMVEWTCRSLPSGGLNIKVTKVLHWSHHGNVSSKSIELLDFRFWIIASILQRVEFYADCYIDSYVTLTLSIKALKVSNTISLHGNVIGHNMETNTWESRISPMFLVPVSLTWSLSNLYSVQFIVKWLSQCARWINWSRWNQSQHIVDIAQWSMGQMILPLEWSKLRLHQGLSIVITKLNQFSLHPTTCCNI